MSSYMLMTPGEEGHQIKLLATIRRQSIRDFTRKLYQRELLAAARKSGEMR